jgi:DHA1 family multidrug resistance protein-like MFS transporter
VDRDWRMEATLRQTGRTHDRTAHVHDLETGSPPGSYGVLDSSRSNNNTCNDDKDDTSSDESNKNGRIVVECPPDDPIDARNWPLLHRAETIAILFLLVFVQGWAGAADSMANSKASEQFHVGTTSENLATAMFLFGIGTGCFFAGPLSESFGRNPVILISTFVYLFFVLGTALSDTFGGHIVCRYLVGLSASGTLGINGAIVNDLFRPVERALWFPLVAWVNVVRKYSQRIID